MVDMFASSWRSQVAAVRSFRRAICSRGQLDSVGCRVLRNAAGSTLPGGGTSITFTGGVHGDRHMDPVSLRVVPLGIAFRTAAS